MADVRKKIAIALISVGVVAGILFFITTWGDLGKIKDLGSSYSISPVVYKNQITIRNLTENAVVFTIKPLDSQGQPKQEVLKARGFSRYPTKSSMVLTYWSQGIEIPRTIITGSSYCFRYDENNQVHLYIGSHMREDVEDLAPYVPTPREVVAKMLQMAGVDKKDVVYDLGCGDGRIIICAAQKYGARGVGIDFDPRRIKEAEANVRKSGVETLVKFRIEDATKTNFSEATVVTLYLLPESNALLRPNLERYLRPGAAVVSHNYEIPGWDEKLVETATVTDSSGDIHSVFLYHR